MIKPWPWWSALAGLILAPGLLAGTLLLGDGPPERGLYPLLPLEPVEEIRTRSLVCVGDIMLARGVAERSAFHNDPAWPFRPNLFLTAAADLACGNLESLFSPAPASTPGHLSFQLGKESADGLRTAGFDVLFLANNHSANVGPAGISYTCSLLANSGIAPCGAGENLAAAHRPALLDLGDRRVAFLSYTSTASLTAGENSPGHSAWGLDLLSRDIARARAEADLVVVSLHGGQEYATQPDAEQRDFAHAAIDYGADLVIGHHPHVLQPVELYRGKPICYSLGNYIFDQPWNYDAQLSAAAEILFRNGIPRRLVIHPLIINTDFQSTPAPPDRESEILQRLGLDSSRLVLD